MTSSPSTLKIKTAEFRFAATSLHNLPRPTLPEVAIIGRSNVGKSTLINRLTNRKHLARTSSTPGRTQELNYFEIALSLDEMEKQLFLVDLPGFGFAKMSKEKRETLSKLTVDYLSARKPLRAICLLNDCRREPEEEELALRDLAFESEKHVLVILTKIDKLGRNDLTKQVKKIASAYALAPQDLILTGTKGDPAKVWERVMGVL